MIDYKVFKNENVPEIYSHLYRILEESLNQKSFPYEKHEICFRCQEDVIVIKFEDLDIIYIGSEFIKINFSDNVWICPYSNITDIWIEPSYVDDAQTTFDDYEY